ncbi:glycosyltransferase family 9 protein [Phaeovibrio sulfidiphilus]|uniref:Glycosyltransferase family 9 protein n=1 Tax=Phaeovibrio sulfidiphilus TaxID=1220600 RepID=A0A8J7CRD0_9PROT|nr:glycosyltransferase family 9 protein [Phaeovibrio sulfidiphilus]MBE1237575.1 glycosyltransferase family 9 protein [Phaeovibrio sulfidiphilus]
MALFRKTGPDRTPESVLFYSNGEAFGDGALQLPMLQGLRSVFPQARFVWLTETRTAYATSLRSLTSGLIDDLWTLEPGLPGHTPAPAELFSTRFGAILDLRRFLKRTLWLRLRLHSDLFVSPALGYRLSARRPADGRKDPPLLRERMMRWASLVAGTPLEPGPFVLKDPKTLELARHLLPDEGRYMGFFPGAGTLYKRWPLERVIAVALHERTRGFTPVFALGPDDRDLEAPLRAALPDALYPLGDPAAAGAGPGLSIALARRMTGVVANDGGAAHIAALGASAMVFLTRGQFVRKKYAPVLPYAVSLAPEDFGVAAETFEGRIDAIPVQAVLDALAALQPGQPLLASRA